LNGVLIKSLVLFGGIEQTIYFSRISSVNLDCSFVWYSTIVMEKSGVCQINAKGSLKYEFLEMKELLLKKMSDFKTIL
jgi:hypothetical protein